MALSADFIDTDIETTTLLYHVYSRPKSMNLALTDKYISNNKRYYGKHHTGSMKLKWVWKV